MQISVKSDKQEIAFQLNDSDAAKDLAKQLPLTTKVKDYSDDEKILYLPQKLRTSNTPATSAQAGDLAYFAPWGDVVMFYKPFAAYPGLYSLGHAVSGGSQIASLQGKITIKQK